MSAATQTKTWLRLPPANFVSIKIPRLIVAGFTPDFKYFIYLKYSKPILFTRNFGGLQGGKDDKFWVSHFSKIKLGILMIYDVITLSNNGAFYFAKI